MQEIPELVARGQEALGRGAWEEARACFEQTLAEQESAVAWEGLGWAAWWLDDGDLSIRAREAAHRVYRRAGDHLAAARMALWVGSDYEDFRGDLSIGRGWREKARRLLEGLPTAAEHAWLPMFEAEVALLLEGDPATARSCARRALALARECGVRDVEILGRAAEGLALVEEGEIEEGMKRLEEAAASVLAGELDEEAWASRVLCYLIFACERVRDHERAAEWCQRMRAAAERTPSNLARGICRAHYAGVLIWRGRWTEAEEQLQEASDFLRTSRPPYVAESAVRLADLRLRQGRMEEAATLFRSVEWHPLALLGLAELFLETGRPKDAEEQIDRYLRTIPETNRLRRAAALELQIRVLALLGNHAGATAALAALREVSSAVGTVALQAGAAFAAGMMTSAAGDHEGARVHLQDAVGQFERGGTPYEAARARLELASVLVTLDRLERAREEAEVAHAALERLGSPFFGGRAAALLLDLGRRSRSHAGMRGDPALTGRQLGVLRLIADGLSDREIAARLGVSVHTVHRHVANILTRLDVPTRAAAVAEAVDRREL